MECPNKCASVDVERDTKPHAKPHTMPHRRGVLGFLALAASMLGFSSLARAVEKLGMVDVDYQHSPKGKQRCDNCRVWDPPNHCLSVDGEISPSGWCLIWRPQYKSQYAKVDADGKLTQGDVRLSGQAQGQSALRQLPRLRRARRLQFRAGQSQSGGVVQYLAQGVTFT